MNCLEKVFALIFIGASAAISVTHAFAMNVGESGGFAEMQAKLASENQIEIATAVTGGDRALRGVKFYYSRSSRLGYIALTDDPARPTKMRIVLQTTDTDFRGPVVVPPPESGIEECKVLIAQQRVKKDDCSSLYSMLKAGQDDGRVFFQQGKLTNGNVLVSVLNVLRGDGTVYESTQNGATTSKLAFGGAHYTDQGSRVIANLRQP